MRLGSFGREGWDLGPVFFHVPGSGVNSETYTSPIEWTEEHCKYKLNSPAVIAILAKQEKLRPGAMKKGLAWIAPWPEPPSPAEIKGVKVEPFGKDLAITLKLKEEA